MANHLSGISSLGGTPTQARVTLINSVTNTIVSAQLSDATTGAWAFPNLPAGTYEVITMIDGYKARVDGPWTLDGTDSFYSNVVSLLHFDGADASTTFTDETGKTWTANGNAQLDTAQKKFGSASLLLDGSGDEINASASTDFQPSEDFTAECWFKVNSYGTKDSLYLMTNRALTGSSFSNVWSLTVSAANGPGWSWWFNDSSGSACVLRAAVPAGEWHHVACTRKGNILRLFYDGVLADSFDITGKTYSGSAAGSTFRIGRGNNGGLPTPRDFNGWIDEVRITKGVARYVNNFVPPAAAFPNA